MKKYRLEEYIVRHPEKKNIKKALANAMGISLNRLYVLLGSTWDDNVNIKTDQLWAAAKFFGVTPNDLLNEPVAVAA